jgi:predicted nucleotidyltransferase
MNGGPIQPIKSYSDQLSTLFQASGVVLAYLYGSQAAGSAGPLSDVDIAVLFGPGIPDDVRFKRVLALHSELADVFKRDDVNIIDLADGPPLLNNEIRLHGVIVYCPNDEVRVEFETRALQRFLDTAPLRRELNRYLREKIRRGLFGRPIPIEPDVRKAR